jgi:LysR family transcriptional regulator, glycine cleavage system transcriptional activator
MAGAATALGVTPGAVSQRIKELEALVGHRLLERSAAGVAMTRAGRRLFERIDDPLRALEAGYNATSGRGRGQRIVVTTTPSLAVSWLVERLAGFGRAYPGIEIAVEADNAIVDLPSDAVDLAIRHGLGEYRGLKSHWLMAPAQIVVGSPRLLARGPAIKAPEDCLRYPLLHDIERKDWAYWLEGLGRQREVPKGGHAFSSDTLLVRAALAGQGLALVYDTYAAQDIAAGRLVQPYKGRWPSKFAYYLVGLPETFRRPEVRRFKAWLSAEASKAP